MLLERARPPRLHFHAAEALLDLLDDVVQAQQVLVDALELALPGEHVVFELNSTGRVARVKFGENYVIPIADW